MDLLISNLPDVESDLRLDAGKENMIGRAIFKGSELLCPVSTSSALAIAEQPELRAYKLGKQKCSYNQVELVIKDVGPGKVAELKVSEAIETCVGPEVDEQLRESCLKFNVRFVNNNRMHLYIYVVYATPYGTSRTDKHSVLYHWIPVTRAKCRKGCKGPVIRGLQRFGRMPRRSAASLEGEDSWKEPRHLYIAIDEASTHVCPRHETSKFRLLVAAYDDKNQLLGTTVSSSIRVLANNDAPLGAASFKLHCHIKGGWTAGATEAPIRAPNNRLVLHEKTVLNRAPLQDILHSQNSSPPKSYQSTTTDETAKQGDMASAHTPLLELEHKVKLLRTTLTETTSASKIEKEHSLTDLCQRLFKGCVAKQEHGQATITLRGLANSLGARRRRILEILNVLESIHVVQHQGKERYTWIGSSQIARALVKLKGNVREGRETPDCSRSFTSPSRRGKSKSSIPRQIEEIKMEMNSPMRALSKRFIQVFLIHEKVCSVPWEHIVEYIVDGQGHDPETIRAKTRRLGEIARIFTALNLIKRLSNQRSQSGFVYEWLGSQGVAEYLVTMAATMSRKVDGRRTRTYQSRIKSPTKEKIVAEAGADDTDGGSRRNPYVSQYSQTVTDLSLPSSIKHPELDNVERSAPGRKLKRKYTDLEVHKTTALTSPCNGNFIISQQPKPHISARRGATTPGPLSNPFRTSRGSIALSDAYQLCQSSLSGHIRGEISSQLDASISHQLSKLPTWKTQADILAKNNVKLQALDLSSGGQQAQHDLETEVRTAEWNSCEHELLDSPSSSGRASGEDNSPEKTDEGSTTTERYRDEISIYGGNHPGHFDEGMPNIRNEFSLRQELVGSVSGEPHDSRIDIEICGSKVALKLDDIHLPINKSIPSQDNPMDFRNNCKASHQFPYKKRRKFDVTPFASFEESNNLECDFSRGSHSPPFYDHDGHLGQVLEGNRIPTFDPLFHLLWFNGTKGVLELQSRDPAFLFNYVKESRALYHKWCAQTEIKNVVRPVAKVGHILSIKLGPSPLLFQHRP